MARFRTAHRSMTKSVSRAPKQPNVQGIGRFMKLVAAATAVGPLVAVGLAAMPAPASAVRMCQGKPATIAW
jgi:hypothetical protein